MMNTYDAIVIGSGITGGWAAKELTEKGLRTIMLERGRNIEHVKDYVTAMKNPWDLPHRGMTPLADKTARPVVGNSWASTEQTIHSWAKEDDCPYTQVKPFSWFRSYQMGGRSLLWGRQCYRWSDLDFGANERDGWAIDWPVRYKDLAPWYDHVERHVGVSGSHEGLEHLPDGQFLPPMEMNCVEKDVASRLKVKYKGERHMIIGRTANLTAPITGRSQCQFRNRCWEGCPFGGYFSTQSSTLPAAMQTGKLTVRPYSIVTRILYDRNTKRAKGVEVLDAETNMTYEYYAKVVFLNASTMNSAWVLMNSATDIWPEGLGSSSGELGHNIMDHHMGVGAYGIAKGFEDKYYYGRRPNSVYITRFANVGADKRDYLRGFGYLGSASRQEWQRNIAELSIGADYKEALTEPGQWAIGITGFGELLPYHDNRVYLDTSRHDKWGLPVLAMDVSLRDNERKMRKDMQREAQEMLEAAGLKGVSSWEEGHLPGAGIHEMGSARMGRDPKTSVLNPHNQVWDALNVYVTDGACMVSSACQNPSLTYMALTARAVDHAVGELSRQNL